MWDDEPRPKATLSIGMPLDTISAGELREMIETYQAEIARLEAEIAKKEQQKAAAANFFTQTKRISPSMGAGSPCSLQSMNSPSSCTLPGNTV